VVLLQQLVNNPQKLAAVLFDELHIHKTAVREGLAGDAIAHAVHIHGDLQADGVVLRVDEHDLVLQKLEGVLHEDALVLLPWVFGVAGRDR
jgi:hypothetical protein